MLSFLTLALVLFAGPLSAQEELQPKTYTSPSGRWSLRVEPSERSGTKGAEYVLTGGEREAWRKTHPFALWDAVVTDDGRVAGYSVSRRFFGGEGQFHVVALAPSGDVLLDELHEMEVSRYLHGADQPYPVGLFAHPDLGRFVVRVHDDDWNELGEEWWAYEFATGKSLYRTRPRQKLAGDEPLVHIFAVRPIPETPLLLVQWRRLVKTSKPWVDGVAFQLVDPDWSVAWSLDLPHDYEVEGDTYGNAETLAEMREQGALLAVEKDRFTVRLKADEARVTFALERDGEAWKVTELERTPYAAPKVQAPPEITARRLALRARIPLGAPPKAGAEIRDITAFGFDESSHLRFVRREDENTVSLVLLDANGSVRRATSVQEFDGKGITEWFPLAAERWLEVSATFDQKPARMGVVSEADGRTSEIPGFSAQSVKRVAALGADSFVLLGAWTSPYTSSSGLVACDLTGRILWTLGAGEGDERILFSPGDVDVTTDGRVVVLEKIRNTLKVYSSAGEFLQKVDLAEAWGREPNYPSGLHPDRDGGVLVHDFQGRPPLYRMSREGVVTASFDARRADGSALDEYRRYAQAAPDGRLWTTDRHEFLRLDDTGRVDLEFGSPESLEGVTEPGYAEIESLFGRVLLLDRRTRAVHVFDGEGRRVTLCQPKAEERDALSHSGSLSVAVNGSVFVGKSKYDTQPLYFTPDGVSQGFQNAKAAAIAFAPSMGEYLGVCGAIVRRFSAGQEMIASLDKRPDGQWFRSIEALAVAEDGSLAVLDVPETDGLRTQPGQACVALFGSQGEARRVWPVPAPLRPIAIAFQGGRIVLADWEHAWLMDAESGALVALALDESAWRFGLSPGGGELWAVAKDGRSLLRYGLEE